MLNGALEIEMVSNSFSESKKDFGRLRKHGTNQKNGSNKKILRYW